MAQLPAEVWLIILAHLSETDKLSVRASCKYFKKLVDQGSLWRNWTVVLNFRKTSYHSKFWASLRRRRVSSAVVRGDKEKDLEQLALSLPALATVVLERDSLLKLACIGDFPKVRRVAVRSRGGPMLLDPRGLFGSWQLTHLSLCGMTLPFYWVSDFISTLSQLTKLSSFTCHQSPVGQRSFLEVIHDVLFHLPQLKHLSLSAELTLDLRGAANNAGLSSLELIECAQDALPEEAMRVVPGLTTLAVLYKKSHHETSVEWSTGARALQTWLRDLPHLSVLVVARGPPVRMYATCIPATLTSLTLCVARLTPEDLATIALQVPNLLHLHVDPWPSYLGPHTADIPRLFPNLKTLKLCLEHVPEKDFLCLQQLRDLEHLEILDYCQHFSKLISRFQVLTQYKLKVTAAAPRPRDVLLCHCVQSVY